MWRWTAAVLCIAALPGSATAAADTPVPQLGSSCAANLVDAMTWPPDAKAPLVCTAGAWQPVATPYPIGERWVSYGPAMRLHGDGLRNPVIESGNWTATPLTPDDRCRAEQLAVVPGVGVGPPRIDEGGPGQVMTLPVVPKLFSIDMSGNCLWQKVAR